MNNKTVVVGMSGGVDSSVTAALLKGQGFNVIGVFMKNWTTDMGFGCPWVKDSEDARKVCQKLDIPFYIWDFEKDYYNRVVKYFFAEYKAGRTPNPDVMCNKEIKFKLFLEKALKLADFVATGHYARVRHQRSDNSYHLLKAKDPAKEQSYFLYTLTKKELSKVLFPIGRYKKAKVREMAREFKLPNYAKKDSQGICFIGPVNVTEFLRKHIKAKSGVVVNEKNQKIGKHIGLPFYTIGQREGIGIGGAGPYYVIEKDAKRNRLVVTNNPNDKKLWRKEFLLNQISWTNTEPKFPIDAKVAIRYHHPEAEAKILKEKNGLIKVKFLKPQRAITVGQSAVIYQGQELLGGGVINKVF